jgi:hypothetical protein
MKGHISVIALLCASVMLWGAASKGAGAASTQAETQVAFFENLKKLCGQRFEGETAFPLDKDPLPRRGG